MWDTVDSRTTRLAHDLPCFQCGHAVHVYLACSDTCACVPSEMPGAVPLTASLAAALSA